MNGLERWHHVMKEGDMEALYDLLHPDCVFISPVVHTPQEGREITYAYLRAANKALSEDFSTCERWCRIIMPYLSSQ